MRRVTVLLLGLFLWSSLVQAQDTGTLPPIIAVSHSDFFAINPTDGSIKQLTDHQQTLYSDQPGSQRDLALSPDGRYLAYRQTPQFFVEGVRDNVIGNYGESPSNIVILDLTTGEEKLVAEQEPGADVNNSLGWWYRGSLAWSPDSTRLIYFQYRNSFEKTNLSGQIMSVHVDTYQITTLIDSLEVIYRLGWSGDSIIADTTVLTSTGAPIVKYYLNEWMISNRFIRYQGRDYVMVDSADVTPHDGRVYVIDLLTGEYGVIDGVEASVSAVSPEDSLVFIKDDNDTRPSSVINPKTGSRFTPPKQAPYAVDFTFSLDGQQFAYILLNTSVNISDLSGNERVVPFDADTILWSGKQYTVASTTGDQSAPVMPTHDFDNAKRCGTLPAVGLTAGGQGKVIVGGGPNRIRSTPNAESDVIGQIPEGATFNVVNGQQGVCSNAIRWAQVEYEGVTGWTAEGADGELFLETMQ